MKPGYKYRNLSLGVKESEEWAVIRGHMWRLVTVSVHDNVHVTVWFRKLLITIQSQLRVIS